MEELADNFPGFQDSGLYTPAAAAAEGAPEQQQQQQQPITVLYLRKAQSLAADLEARFGGEDERFRWTDADKLTADSGECHVTNITRYLWMCNADLEARYGGEDERFRLTEADKFTADFDEL